MVPDAGHSFQDGGNQSALIAATEHQAKKEGGHVFVLDI
jgi:hypothetical protein